MSVNYLPIQQMWIFVLNTFSASNTPLGLNGSSDLNYC